MTTEQAVKMIKEMLFGKVPTKFAEARLMDGTKVSNNLEGDFEIGQTLYVVAEDVTLVLAPSGPHTLEDGVEVVLDEASLITEIKAEGAETTEETMEEVVVDVPEEVEIAANDLRIDVYRSSGPGGQSVNTTDSAVRITHLPTGIVVAMQNEKSQLQNKEAAMRILRARILAAQQEEIEAEQSAARKSQVRTVDRSERIRTYNFPENRIADHRTGYKSYNLDQVMDGALEPVVQSCIQADEEARLKALGND
jgi:protein subunit release factor B